MNKETGMNENTTGAILSGGVVIAQVEHHDLVSGYPEPPADPMDELGCDSCQ
ncbi:hypothetical protein ACFOYW_17035 [Gryllotalpicola reticulitermitis]|uniref:Uncharacterized protein n=1 Tax=Gryllotalpicola reticulitermitis TaxID=1184153 RepID=A0ABV8QC18_9MICO